MPKLVELDARQRKACMVKAKLPCAMSSINRSAMKLPRVLESLVRTVLSHASNGSQTPKGRW
jgi:hypothetical protein